MTDKVFLKNIHRRIAQVTIGSSALRNQGAPNMVEITRAFLEKDVSLKSFFDKIEDERRFNSFLNSHTEKLRKSYPKGAKHWGTARKSLNLFFRELVYNKFIADSFGLPKSISNFNKSIVYLEVPLDKDVAKGIKKYSKISTPKWEGIIHLTEEVSRQYQDNASQIAAAVRIPRVHLDLVYWRPKDV